MINHPLSPLLTPRSIAVVGASPRENTTGNTILRTLRHLGFTGSVYPVNPRYAEIEGLPCYPSLAAVEEPVDLAVLAVANDRLEEQLRQAVDSNARAAAIFGSCVLAGDADPPLAERLSRIAREARMPICGGNSMGFCNYEARIRITSFPFVDREPGPIAFLSHSGSVFHAIANNSRRVGLSFAVSAGRELATTMSDYMDYALSLPSTRAIGLFIETARDPGGFVAALERARERDIPVVALKVGRTEESAKMAVSHSGVIAGDDVAYTALFDRWGVSRVHTLDEMIATLLVMAQPRRAVLGGVASLHESGGEREMVVDLAAEIGIPFARINETTKARLAERLDFGLEPMNPLDAFGTGHDYGGVLRDCFSALMDDPDTGIGIFFLDVQQDNLYSDTCVQACLDAAARTEKPTVLATNYSAVDHHEVALRITRAGVPVLDGTVPALKAVRHALDYRDFRARRTTTSDPIVSESVINRWRSVLARGRVLPESEAVHLLADYGIPVLPTRVVASVQEAAAAAAELGYPAVLKTAAPEHAHKSDVHGVRLNLTTADEVAVAYQDLARRLGPQVLVAPYAPGGVEMVLGVKVDPQFGPVVLVGAGGTLVELIRDVRAALAPVDAQHATRLIESLKVRRLLDGVRGSRPADVAALVDAIVRLSVLAADLSGNLAEVDINPFVVQPDRCIALDALVIPVSAR